MKYICFKTEEYPKFKFLLLERIKVVEFEYNLLNQQSIIKIELKNKQKFYLVSSEIAESELNKLSKDFDAFTNKTNNYFDLSFFNLV
ncbi:MAG: hypothetical protein RIR51_226 [Bacteroidota bacterium]